MGVKPYLRVGKGRKPSTEAFLSGLGSPRLNMTVGPNG